MIATIQNMYSKIKICVKETYDYHVNNNCNDVSSTNEMIDESLSQLCNVSQDFFLFVRSWRFARGEPLAFFIFNVFE